MSYLENYHPTLDLAALDREITFIQAQLACYSRALPPHPGVKWGQVCSSLRCRLDALEARRALLERRP